MFILKPFKSPFSHERRHCSDKILLPTMSCFTIKCPDRIFSHKFSDISTPLCDVTQLSFQTTRLTSLIPFKRKTDDTNKAIDKANKIPAVTCVAVR